jgi:hypothetical protein
MATSSGSQPSPMQAETCSENSRQPRGISTRQTLGSPWARTSLGYTSITDIEQQ